MVVAAVEFFFRYEMTCSSSNDDNKFLVGGGNGVLGNKYVNAFVDPTNRVKLS